MHHHYADIRKRIPTPPLWWDENAVPRYDPFDPNEGADIYAQEIILLKIRCQSCGRPFEVAMSWSAMDEHVRRVPSLEHRINERTIRYGDPPNVECCPAGPTMNSEPDRVLQFWRRKPARQRVPALEIDVEASWAGDP